MSTPSIPGVDREALAAEIEEATFVCSELTARRAADAAIAYIAAHQEPRVCACGAKYDRCPDCAADDAYERGRKDAAHQEPRVCACGAKYDRCPDCAADDAYERGRKDAACDLEHADAPDPLEAPGTALGRAYRPYVTSGTVPTLNGAVAACHVCRGETGTPCHPDPTEGDQA